MESKEAVLELIIEAESLNRNDSRLCFLKKIIEKDLEILEILKKHIEINEHRFNEKGQSCIDILIPQSDECFIEIKEWLESQIKMEELTEKEDIYLKSDKECEYNLTSSNDGIAILKGDPIEIMSLDKATEKLHAILEIEEELGIDLITLFKASEYGFYMINEGQIKFVKQGYQFNLRGRYIHLNSGYKKLDFKLEDKPFSDILLFKDYGATWSIDRKDLEQ